MLDLSAACVRSISVSTMDRMDQLPLPNLQLYSVFSGFVVFYAVVYALTAAGSFTSTLVNDVWCTAVSESLGITFPNL